MNPMRCGVVVLAALIGSCAGPQQPPPLTIAAAASLAPVFDELGAIFEELTGAEVVFSYGATGSLAEQIRNGAPFDAFASADARHVDELIAEGLLVGDTRTVFALGKLVLVAAPGAGLELKSVADLTDPSTRTVAIANPAHAPYGVAAIQALQRAGVEPQVRPKLVYGESVQQTGQLVLSGNASAGLLSATTALSLDLRGLELPQELYDPILNVAAIHVNTPHRELAIRFVDFLGSPEVQIVFERFGLLIPER